MEPLENDLFPLPDDAMVTSLADRLSRERRTPNHPRERLERIASFLSQHGLSAEMAPSGDSSWLLSASQGGTRHSISIILVATLPRVDPSLPEPRWKDASLVTLDALGEIAFVAQVLATWVALKKLEVPVSGQVSLHLWCHEEERLTGGLPLPQVPALPPHSLALGPASWLPFLRGDQRFLPVDVAVNGILKFRADPPLPPGTIDRLGHDFGNFGALSPALMETVARALSAEASTWTRLLSSARHLLRSHAASLEALLGPENPSLARRLLKAISFGDERGDADLTLQVAPGISPSEVQDRLARQLHGHSLTLLRSQPPVVLSPRDARLLRLQALIPHSEPGSTMLPLWAPFHPLPQAYAARTAGWLGVPHLVLPESLSGNELRFSREERCPVTALRWGVAWLSRLVDALMRG